MFYRIEVKTHSLYFILCCCKIQKSTIQAVSYTRDIQALDQALVLYSTYYIGNAKVEPITIENFRYCTSPFQLTLTRGTFIKEADQENQYPIDQCYNFTPFRDFYKYMDTNTNPISTTSL